MSMERLLAILEDKIQDCESEPLDDEATYENGYVTALRWVLDFVEEQLLRDAGHDRADDDDDEW